MADRPKDAYSFCPRCGSDAFEPNPGNSLSCGSCEFTWYYNVASAVDVIIRNSAGEILVTRRARPPHVGKLDLPGGFVDVGESLESAARREVREEVGLALDELSYLGSFPNEYAFGGVVYYALDVIMTATVDCAALDVGDDVSSAVFVSPEDLDLDEVGLDSTRAALRHYLGS